MDIPFHLKPDDRKVVAVRDWPIAKDAGEMRQFLGLASYKGRYVLHFADIAGPLHNLTQKDTLFTLVS